MTEKSKPITREYLVSDLIAKSIEAEGLQETYANHAQIMVTQSEIFLDFYYIKQNKKSVIQAQHVQRMILPHSIGKALATAIANVIAAYEEENGITLLNSRSKQPDDRIEIWTT